MSAGVEKLDKKRAMAADPTSRDDADAKKSKTDLGTDGEENPSPGSVDRAYALIFAKIAQDKIDQESAPLSPEENPTIAYFEPPTWFHTDELFPVRESGTKAVLSAAKFLLGVSSSVGGEQLKRCSGFWVDWDGESKTGLVLTTARLIRTKDPPLGVWSGGEEYAPHAHITVHLLDGTNTEGQLVYYQPHYDIAFLKVKVNQSIKLPSFSEEDVNFATEVFRLGRDNSLNLRITYARAEYLNPTMYERHHNVYFRSPDGDDNNNEYDNGGRVIDLAGKVVGMVNVPERFGSFIPSSILLNCLDSWKKYGHIARPHLGMMFKAIKLLEPAHVDMLWRMFNVDDGLVVQEVSGGSHAEKIGIQTGDIIESINGKHVSSTIELHALDCNVFSCNYRLENTLMSICKGASDVEVHVSVGVFDTLKKHRSTRELTANLSELGEVIISAPMRHGGGVWHGRWLA